MKKVNATTAFIAANPVHMSSKPQPVAAPATTIVAGKEREAPVISAVRNDIAIPQRTRSGGGKSAYDFSVLTAVGQSIGIVNKTKENVAALVARTNRKNCTETTDPVTGKVNKTYSAKYEAFEVDPKTDPDGAKVRVFRTI